MEQELELPFAEEEPVLEKRSYLPVTKSIATVVQFIILLGLAAGWYLMYEDNKNLRSDISDLQITLQTSTGQLERGIRNVESDVESISNEVSDVHSTVESIDTNTSGLSNVEFEVDRISRIVRYGY